MKNSLRIKSEKWPEVTDSHHYKVDLNYEGYSYGWDDIYFDDVRSIILKFKKLVKERKGSVELDGGFRFKIVIETTSSGGIVLKFKAESDAKFPGKLILEGYFSADGENTENVIGALVKLFTNGKDFSYDEYIQPTKKSGAANEY